MWKSLLPRDIEGRQSNDVCLLMLRQRNGMKTCNAWLETDIKEVLPLFFFTLLIHDRRQKMWWKKMLILSFSQRPKSGPSEEFQTIVQWNSLRQNKPSNRELNGNMCVSIENDAAGIACHCNRKGAKRAFNGTWAAGDKLSGPDTPPMTTLPGGESMSKGRCVFHQKIETPPTVISNEWEQYNASHATSRGSAA